jgi:hypothetical protein
MFKEKKIFKKYKKIENINNILFVISFFIFRICFHTILLYKHYYYTIPSQKYLIPIIPLICQNTLEYYWFIKIIKIIIKKISNKKHHISINDFTSISKQIDFNKQI